MSQPQVAPANMNGDPLTAVIETSDLRRFIDVYRSSAPAFANLETSLQQRYLDLGTPGLRSFARLRIGSAALLADTIRGSPRFYASIIPQLEEIDASPAIAQRIRSAFSNLKMLVPDALFPPTTFVVGRLTTGGTVSDQGILIGSEFLSASPDVLAAAPNAFIANNVLPPASAYLIVAHEAAHIQQARWMAFFSRANRTLLESALIEGGADFIAELTAGAHSNASLAQWATPREAELWLEFRAQMNGTDISRWLYNQDRATPDRPGDIGYYIGRRICQAYYDRQANKVRAVRDILSIADANAFLIASGYAPMIGRP